MACRQVTARVAASGIGHGDGQRVAHAEPRAPLVVVDVPHHLTRLPGHPVILHEPTDAPARCDRLAARVRGSAECPPARRTVLVLAGIVLLSFNLRPAAVSVGPVLEEVRDGLGLSGPEAGLLTSLPVLAFAVFGALAPSFARVVGAAPRRRRLAGGRRRRSRRTRRRGQRRHASCVLSAVALAGMATANVLLPSLVKLHFPDRIGQATAIYTTALAIGLTSAFLLTVPIARRLRQLARRARRLGADRAGRAGPLARAGRPTTGTSSGSPAASRSPTWHAPGSAGRWSLFFGLQSMQAYSIFGWFAQLWRDNGYDAGQAGALVGIVAAVSIPISLWLPSAVARRDNQVSLILSVLGCYLVGYGLLLVDAHAFAIPAALLIGVGCCIFPLVLTLIGLRARTPDGTAALSGFTQSLGYLMAALGPFLVGTIYDATGGWTAPLWLLLLLVLPLMAVGAYVGRPAYLEDQLR